MKKLLLLVLLALPGHAEFASPSKAAKSYHKSLKCVAMLRVKEPVELSAEQAKAKKLKPCGNCYRVAVVRKEAK